MDSRKNGAWIALADQAPVEIRDHRDDGLDPPRLDLAHQLVGGQAPAFRHASAAQGRVFVGLDRAEQRELRRLSLRIDRDRVVVEKQASQMPCFRFFDACRRPSSDR